MLELNKVKALNLQVTEYINRIFCNDDYPPHITLSDFMSILEGSSPYNMSSKELYYFLQYYKNSNSLMIIDQSLSSSIIELLSCVKSSLGFNEVPSDLTNGFNEVPNNLTSDLTNCCKLLGKFDNIYIYIAPSASIKRKEFLYGQGSINCLKNIFLLRIVS